ncbi:MAG: acid phosphatase [Phycisphaerales bacterium]|nr:acid phosphatase [Phycisphaerales bacterium]
MMRLFPGQISRTTCKPLQFVESLESRQLLSTTGVIAHSKPPATPPQYDHVVIVVEENHSYSKILGKTSKKATSRDPTIRGLASAGASFTNSHGITHPSEPNYLALFSGSTQGVTSDVLPTDLITAPSLAGQLLAAGHTFASYSQGLPYAGYQGEESGSYVRRHAPWTQFADVPPATNLPFSAFPRDFNQLPTVSFVLPDLLHDMHDGTIAAGDRWLHQNLSRYAHWARSHNSLLIVTWDENGGAPGNQIPTFFVGAHVRAGKYKQPIDHYSVLRTIEGMYGLPPLANAAGAAPITNAFAH